MFRYGPCLGPEMDPQTGVMECPDGRHEPSDEDCDRCQHADEDDPSKDATTRIRTNAEPERGRNDEAF